MTRPKRLPMTDCPHIFPSIIKEALKIFLGEKKNSPIPRNLAIKKEFIHQPFKVFSSISNINEYKFYGVV